MAELELVWGYIDNQMLEGDTQLWWSRVARRYKEMTGEVLMIVAGPDRVARVVKPELKILLPGG